MKTFTLASLLGLASLSLAQLQGLPPCAISCANIFLNGGIGNCGRDATCICSDSGFISAISCCLVQQCDAADQQKAIDFAQQICQAQQVSVPNTVSCSSTPPPGGASPTTSSTGSSSSTPADNSASATTTDTTAATTTSSPSTTGTGSSSSKTSGSGTVASQTTGTTSQGKNAGPRQTAAPVLGALGGIVAIAALL